MRLLPGIADRVVVNLAVTLPAGKEAYAVIGLAVWLSSRTAGARIRRFAMWSSITALAIGSLGQVLYHVLARPDTDAPVWVTVFVSILPVLILGAGAALFHLIGEDQRKLAELASAQVSGSIAVEPSTPIEPSRARPSTTTNSANERTDATSDAAVLAVNAPWEGLSKAAAVRRADALLPERSPRALRAALAEVGVDVPESSIRRVRTALSYEKKGEPTWQGTTLNKVCMTGVRGPTRPTRRTGRPPVNTGSSWKCRTTRAARTECSASTRSSATMTPRRAR